MRSIALRCGRCHGKVWITPAELREAIPGPICCEDCRIELAGHPEQAEREYRQALERSELESRRMRERWARADANKAKKT